MDMNTLDELIYYCEEKEPVGALMLIGEWGCGKTYLIEHELSDKLKESHIIIRVSLFGISSVEAVATIVKQSWTDASLNDKGTVGAWANKARQFKEKLAPLAKANETADAIFSLSASDFVTISNTIGDKTVVLVFDDLERSHLDAVDLLGAINDYCENQKFHTIIVANEERMLKQVERQELSDRKKGRSGSSARIVNNKSDANRPVEVNVQLETSTENKLSYLEIKEKIIQRTIKYKPDYASVIDSIIENYVTNDTDYRDFLCAHKEELHNLFSVGIPVSEAEFERMEMSDEDIAKIRSGKNPHNIRSFKCGIQDFHRVYKFLSEHEIDNLEKWLHSFVMFMIAYKAGLIEESERYGMLFTDIGMEQTYPIFYKDKFMLGFEKAWIIRGEWNEEAAVLQINALKEREEAETAYDIVRTYQLGYIDESVFDEGFPQVLSYAYEGNLTLDDYVNLIINICFARRSEYDLPVEVDWEKLNTGIEKKTNAMLENGEEDTRARQYISEESLQDFSEEERKAYHIISEFRNGDMLMFARNKGDYIEMMKNDFDMAFSKLSNRRFRSFDTEMAEVTAQAFSTCTNADKINFIREFRKMWSICPQSQDTDLDETLDGIQKLAKSLQMEKEKLDAKKKIAIGHFGSFIEFAQKLAEEITEDIERKAGIEPKYVMNLTTIHHIAIIVSDYALSKDFYVNKLGFSIIRENYRPERNDWKLDLQCGNIELEIFGVSNPPARVSNPEACGLRHLAFKVNDVEATVKELEALGIPCEPIRTDEFTGKKMTFFKDPDGLPLELHE